ncbi:MAG: ATP-binding protein [Pseudomonadota bacterium]
MSEPLVVGTQKEVEGLAPGRPLFALRLRSDTFTTRIALAEIFDALAPLGLTPEELSTVELVLAEALNNIMEHAYPADGDGGPVEIECSHLSDGLHFALCDRGAAMPNGALPVGTLPDHEVDTDHLPEGGFGWFLIKDLAKDVEYQRLDDQNRLRLRIAVAYGQVAI